MKIVILGGTGQIGSVITQQVLEDFPNAQIMSCSRRGGKLRHEFKFNVHENDWAVFKEVDVLINAVGIIEENGDNTFNKVHINLVEKIIKERKAIGNPHIIHVSVLGANKNSKSRYAATKGIADELLMEEKNCTIIRPSFVCTPDTTIIQKLRMMHKMSKWQLGFLPIPAQFLKVKFQPVMASDIAELVTECIHHKIFNEIIYAAGPEKYGLRDWIDIMSKKTIKIIPIPQPIIGLPFRLLISIFPQIMNIDQYYLLGEDNTHDFNRLATILKRSPKSTKNFWETEL